MTTLSMNKLRTLATCVGTVALASPLFAQEAPKDTTPEAIQEMIDKLTAEQQAKVEAEALAKAKATPPMDPAEAKITRSYGLGYQNGEQFGSYGFIADDIDKEAYITGLIASMSGKDFGKDEKAYEQAMSEFQKIVTDREIALAKANEAAEKAFLEKNAKREGIITTDTKLQYEILKKGTGKTYTAPAEAEQGIDQSKVFLINCTGTLLDGNVVMKTPEGEPYPFDLNVLPGIAEVLKIMPTGSTWKVYIPSALAFGEQRQGPKISPNSMLIYEIELIEIQDQPVQPQGPLPIIPR